MNTSAMIPTVMLSSFEATTKLPSPSRTRPILRRLMRSGTAARTRDWMMVRMATASSSPLTSSGNSPGPARVKSPSGYCSAPRPKARATAARNSPRTRIWFGITTWSAGGSIDLDPRGLDHPAPFLGLVDDEPPEILGRAGERRAAEVGELALHLGVFQ